MVLSWNAHLGSLMAQFFGLGWGKVKLGTSNADVGTIKDNCTSDIKPQASGEIAVLKGFVP